MKIISVIPLKKSILKGDLTYFTSLNISVGNIVSVPVRSKQTLALVTSTEELEEAKSNVKRMNFNLKKVTEDKGASIFLKEYLDTIFDTNEYFAQNKNRALTSLIPNKFIEEYRKIVKISKPVFEKEKNIDKKLRSEKLLFQYPLQDRISVYKTLIRESFAQNKSVFLILPTQSEIEKFTNQLRKGIEQFTFSLHGGINTKKSLTIYEKIVISSHPILIIGTAPFLSIPREDIGTIILEKENSNAYKMIKRPHFDLRIFAEIYAAKINAKFVLADEMLRFETIGRKDTENLNPLHPLSYRVDFGGILEILGKEEREKGQKFQILRNQSLHEIKFYLENKKSVFIFSLRKGLATETVCKDCGEGIRCEICGAPLVLYLSNQGKQRMFVCNRCMKEADGDTACKNCGSWNLMPFGIGTDTVYEEIAQIFPDKKIFKLDKESAKTATGAKKIIKEFEENPGSILIGTEMTFFYLKNKVPLSIIASFDSLWSIPNFKMSEKIIQIVLSMIANTEEKFILQTKNETDSVIQAIKSGNLLSFIREELEDRRTLGYPPFKRLIKIIYLGDKEQTIKARKFLKEFLKDYNPEIFSGFVSKTGNEYTTNVLIKMDPSKWSLPELSLNSKIDEELSNKLRTLEQDFEILVDPEDLL